MWQRQDEFSQRSQWPFVHWRGEWRRNVRYSQGVGLGLATAKRKAKQGTVPATSQTSAMSKRNDDRKEGNGMKTRSSVATGSACTHPLRYQDWAHLGLVRFGGQYESFSVERRDNQRGCE